MRLKSINIYSDYLGDPDNTKARTEVKYVDNAYLRQLNVCCSPFVHEIISKYY